MSTSCGSHPPTGRAQQPAGGSAWRSVNSTGTIALHYMCHTNRLPGSPSVPTQLQQQLGTKHSLPKLQQESRRGCFNAMLLQRYRYPSLTYAALMITYTDAMRCRLWFHTCLQSYACTDDTGETGTVELEGAASGSYSLTCSGWG